MKNNYILMCENYVPANTNTVSFIGIHKPRGIRPYFISMTFSTDDPIGIIDSYIDKAHVLNLSLDFSTDVFISSESILIFKSIDDIQNIITTIKNAEYESINRCGWGTSSLAQDIYRFEVYNICRRYVLSKAQESCLSNK